MIAETFIRRPVTAIVVSIVITLLGLLAIFVLPIAQYPSITPPTVSVSGTFTGADAQTVEETTTTAVETQINGTPGMTYLSSSSSSTGATRMTVNFEVGTNIDVATLDVQNRVSIAEPTLPEAVRRLGITVRKRNPSIMMVVGFYSPNGTHGREFIGNYVNIFVKDALLRVKGVGDAYTVADQFGMRVWLDPDKLSRLALTPADVAQAIQEQNLQIAAGVIGGQPQPVEQAFEYTILTNSRLNREEDYGNIVVRTNPETGSMVRLKDVAKIELGRFDYNLNSLVEGHPGAMLLLYQTPDANTLDTYDEVMRTLNEMKKSFPKDLTFDIPNESATVINISIEEVLHTFVEALILVVLVVFLFLQSWRATFIPLLAVPVSLIGTFIFFIPLGFTINTLTMFAFVLAIGIVVDDAIVVVEAVQHYIDSEGLSAKEATRKAMKDISGPVIAIALILAVVFIPVSFLPGISGRLYQQFALTIAISVLISAFIALSLTPALCSLMLKPSVKKKKKNLLDKFFDWFNARFNAFAQRYTNTVASWIRRAPYVLVMMVVLIVGLVYLFKHKPTGFVPLEDEGRLFVAYTMPEGTSTTRSHKLMEDIMKTLKDIPAVEVSGGVVGLSIVDFSNKSNAGTIFVKLHPWQQRTQESDKLFAVIATIQQKLAYLTEATIRVIAPPAIPGLGAVAGFAFQLQQRGSTDDIARFEQVARGFVAEVRKRPEIGNVYTLFTTKTPAYQIDVKRDRVKRLGVSLSDVYSTMSTLMGSNYVNDFTRYGRNFRVVTMADAASRSSLESIKKYYVRNNKMEMVPLSQLVDIKVIENPPVISHHNIYRSIEIDGEAAEGHSSGEAIQALREVADTYLPEGYGYEFSGMSYEEIKAGNFTVYVFMGSVVFVFLFLAALYESWSVPFAVIFAVPVGLFGSILTLVLLPKLSNNIYAQIGMLTLIGLAAKNAILIVEFAKERVDAGHGLVEATLEAVRLRLRPIIMTSMAFILGVIPLMYASGAASVSRNTIGWTVFGGMIAATSLAIIVVPVLFVVIMRISQGRKKMSSPRIDIVKP